MKKSQAKKGNPRENHTKQVHVLFIGNSHTYKHDIPLMLVLMAKALFPLLDIGVDSCFGEGASLRWHWENPEIIQKIESGNWDYVVLQERSGGPLEDISSMEEYILKFDRKIRASSGRTVLYMTWARQDRPETQELITKAYDNLHKQIKALLAPVGYIWEVCRSMFPNINFYDPDGRHANALGAYLSACAFFSLLFGQSPEGLSEVIFSREQCSYYGGKDVLSALESISYEITRGTIQP